MAWLKSLGPRLITVIVAYNTQDVEKRIKQGLAFSTDQTLRTAHLLLEGTAKIKHTQIYELTNDLSDFF